MKNIIKICLSAIFLLSSTIVFATTLKKIDYSQSPLFEDDMDYQNLKTGIYQSLNYLDRLPSQAKFRFGGDIYTAKDMKGSLQLFLDYLNGDPLPKQMNSFINTFYNVYVSTGKSGNEDVLFTAYCQPMIKGSLHKSAEFSVPICSKPYDLKQKKINGKWKSGRYDANQNFVPYYTRAQINDLKILERKAEPIAWVNSKLDRLYLEIEGCGDILLPDGNSVHIQYQTKNGHGYSSIGKYMMRVKNLPANRVGILHLKKYFAKHPDELQATININKSFVFFTIGNGQSLGCLNVPITPGRTIATDRSLFPPAALGFIQSKKPVVDAQNRVKGWKNFGRFVLNQDTGGAIKGAGRGDIYFGGGEYAEIAANTLKHSGKMYFMVLKPSIDLASYSGEILVQN